MIRKTLGAVWGSAILALVPLAAQAHSGTADGGFAAGLLHHLSAPDHVLSIILAGAVVTLLVRCRRSKVSSRRSVRRS